MPNRNDVDADRMPSPPHPEDRAAGTNPPPKGGTNYDHGAAQKSSQAAREHKADEKAAARDNTLDDAETAGKRPAGPDQE